MSSSNYFDLSHLKVEKKLGKGSFATVFKIRDIISNQILAAKALRKEIEEFTENEIISFSHEINILSKLDHPTIIKFYGFSPFNFKYQNKPIILTEFVPNGTLASLINLERLSLSVSEWNDTQKLIILYGIASGMSFLHSYAILHRDLKPDNILINEKLYPKISDFGLSKVCHSKNSMTLQSEPSIKGTPLYIAPEIWETEKYDKAGDVYSFAFIAYEMITNDVPFKDVKTISQIYTRIVINGERPKFTYPISSSYRNLIEKCWSYYPKDRPSFSTIVNILKNDRGFITDLVDENEFIKYVNYIDEYQSSFDKKKKILNEEKLFNDFRIEQESINNQDHHMINSVYNSDKIKKDFLIRKSNNESSNIKLGLNDNQHSASCSNDDSISYFEYGKKLFNEAIKYLNIAKNQGNKDSITFLEKNVKTAQSNELNSIEMKPKKVDIGTQIFDLITPDNSNIEKIKVIERPYFDILKKKLSQNPPIEGRTRAVLLCTGAFCPIHYGHLKLLETASQFLPQKKIDPILGIISPSSDIYVTEKMHKDSISFDHRFEMAKLACVEHNENIKNKLCIVPDSWEGMQKEFIDFPEVHKHFINEIGQAFADDNLLVLYVCGNQNIRYVARILHCNLVGVVSPLNTIIPALAEHLHIYFCYEKNYSDASNAILIARKNGERLEGLTYNSVAQYLHDVIHWA